MIICKRVIFAFSLFISLSSASMAAAVDSSWLMGVWELVDKSKTEFLEFKGKKVSLVSGKGRKIGGSFKLTGSAIKIIYKFKGKKIPIELSYSSSKDVLTSALSATGKTVKYTKKQ